MNGSASLKSLPDQAERRSVPGFGRYEVSRAGMVYSKKTGRPLAVRIVRGLPCVDLSPRPTVRDTPYVPVRLLVARAFLPRLRIKQQRHTLHHRDGKVMNCSADNLLWKKPK